MTGTAGTEGTTEREGGLVASRRALLGAAWTAPVIVAASTAPAFAASAAATLVFDTFAAYPIDYTGSTPNRVEMKIQVRREWSATSPVVRSLTVSVPIPATIASGTKPSVSGTGWSAGSVTGPSQGTYTYTVTWTGILDNTTQSTPELLVTLKRLNVAPTTTTLIAYLTSPQATSTSRSISATI